MVHETAREDTQLAHKRRSGCEVRAPAGAQVSEDLGTSLVSLIILRHQSLGSLPAAASGTVTGGLFDDLTAPASRQRLAH
jgi:hypothetical protein